MTITITGARKLTPAQVAALRAEQRRIDETYPGHEVAHMSRSWMGTRTASRSWPRQRIPSRSSNS